MKKAWSVLCAINDNTYVYAIGVRVPPDREAGLSLSFVPCDDPATCLSGLAPEMRT